MEFLPSTETGTGATGLDLIVVAASMAFNDIGFDDKVELPCHC